MISRNIQARRIAASLSQEQLAEKVGVSRQTIAKWESGESSPDLNHAANLACALDVTLDQLVSYDEAATGIPLPPKGKHIFGTVTLGERGQVVIPKQARELFDFKPGDSLVVLGDEEQGLAIMKADDFLAGVQSLVGIVKEQMQHQHS